MKNGLRHILLLLVLVASAAAGHAVAQDTVFFYNTWEQMLSQAPVAVVVDPVIETVTPFELYIDTGDDDINEAIYTRHIAFSLGDSIWLMNSNYLKRFFKGDVKKLNGFVPVFFNEKVAFINYVVTNDWSVSINDYLFDNVNFDGSSKDGVGHYFIDFMRHQVLKVDHSVMSSLLEDYHDLLVRYEGMKDYKQPEIIEEYFYKFIDRATEDIMRPNIVDLVDDKGMQ